MEKREESERRILRASEWPGGPPPAADIFASPPVWQSADISVLACTSSELRWQQHVRQRALSQIRHAACASGFQCLVLFCKNSSVFFSSIIQCNGSDAVIL